jgi:ribosomal protein S18 acetylase RimI-like enzyme
MKQSPFEKCLNGIRRLEASMFTLRFAKDNDVSGMLDLILHHHKESFASRRPDAFDIYSDRVNDILKRGCFIVVERGCRIVGLIGVVSNSIELLVIHDSHRRASLGSTLIHVLQCFTDKLTAVTQSHNTTAIAFYTALGFVELKEETTRDGLSKYYWDRRCDVDDSYSCLRRLPNLEEAFC